MDTPERHSTTSAGGGADGDPHRALERDLFRAVTAEAFDLHYRPHLDRRTGEIIAVDAVVAWTHATRGEVDPAVFWPVAERTSMVIPIGEWVLWQACLQTAAWRLAGRTIETSITVSTQQLVASAFLATIADAIETTQIDAAQLRIVLTGTIDIDDCARVETLLCALRSYGIGVELDAGDRRVESDDHDLLTGDGIANHRGTRHQ